MYSRIGTIVTPYRMKLGLPSYWDAYCEVKVNDEDDAHVKDGSYPLGIADWHSLNHKDFDFALGALEEWRKAALQLCLADVKARLKAADAK